ncbi:uncharacterized protein [Watersipora subatra]|uniref:uncharacterized protein n=1 Tax=Watersipora subatra TaxID=2589382 RepID=UPI00355C1D93
METLQTCNEQPARKSVGIQVKSSTFISLQRKVMSMSSSTQTPNLETDDTYEAALLRGRSLCASKGATTSKTARFYFNSTQRRRSENSLSRRFGLLSEQSAGSPLEELEPVNMIFKPCDSTPATLRTAKVMPTVGGVPVAVSRDKQAVQQRTLEVRPYKADNASNILTGQPINQENDSEATAALNLACSHQCESAQKMISHEVSTLPVSSIYIQEDTIVNKATEQVSFESNILNPDTPTSEQSGDRCNKKPIPLQTISKEPEINHEVKHMTETHSKINEQAVFEGDSQDALFEGNSDFCKLQGTKGSSKASTSRQSKIELLPLKEHKHSLTNQPISIPESIAQNVPLKCNKVQDFGLKEAHSIENKNQVNPDLRNAQMILPGCGTGETKLLDSCIQPTVLTTKEHRGELNTTEKASHPKQDGTSPLKRRPTSSSYITKNQNKFNSQDRRSRKRSGDETTRQTEESRCIKATKKSDSLSRERTEMDRHTISHNMHADSKNARSRRADRDRSKKIYDERRHHHMNEERRHHVSDERRHHLVNDERRHHHVNAPKNTLADQLNKVETDRDKKRGILLPKHRKKGHDTNETITAVQTPPPEPEQNVEKNDMPPKCKQDSKGIDNEYVKELRNMQYENEKKDPSEKIKPKVNHSVIDLTTLDKIKFKSGSALPFMVNDNKSVQESRQLSAVQKPRSSWDYSIDDTVKAVRPKGPESNWSHISVYKCNDHHQQIFHYGPLKFHTNQFLEVLRANRLYLGYADGHLMSDHTAREFMLSIASYSVALFYENGEVLAPVDVVRLFSQARPRLTHDGLNFIRARLGFTLAEWQFMAENL